jgi:hypothetical protein
VPLEHGEIGSEVGGHTGAVLLPCTSRSVPAAATALIAGQGSVPITRRAAATIPPRTVALQPVTGPRKSVAIAIATRTPRNSSSGQSAIPATRASCAHQRSCVPQPIIAATARHTASKDGKLAAGSQLGAPVAREQGKASGHRCGERRGAGPSEDDAPEPVYAQREDGAG